MNNPNKKYQTAQLAAELIVMNALTNVFRLSSKWMLKDEARCQNRLSLAGVKKAVRTTCRHCDYGLWLGLQLLLLLLVLLLLLILIINSPSVISSQRKMPYAHL